MTTIAKLTKQQDGGFIGTLAGIGIQPRKIELQPTQSDNDPARHPYSKPHFGPAPD